MGFKTIVRAMPSAWVAACLTASGCPLALGAERTPGVAYVSDQNGDIGVIDLATLETTSSVSAYGKEPRGIGITADGKLLVVANREGGRIAVIDRASGQLLRHVAVGANPEFVRVRGHLAFVTCEPSASAGPPGAASGAKPAEAASASAARDDDSHEPAHIAVVDLDTGRLVVEFQ